MLLTGDRIEEDRRDYLKHHFLYQNDSEVKDIVIRDTSDNLSKTSLKLVIGG